MSRDKSVKTHIHIDGTRETDVPALEVLPQAKCRQILERISRKNYYLAKAYGILDFYLSNPRGKEPLVVYQMGKVGSTTILKSLEALDLDMSIHHAHFLTQEGIDWAEGVYKKRFSSRHHIARHFFDSRYLRKQIDRGLEGKKWKVVTLVREPIARNISSFFQILDHQFSDYGYQQKVKYMKTEELVEELIELFLEKFEHDTPLTWFDSELKSVFGIDVFATDFPKSKGYRIYEGEQAEVLLLRLEDINECAPKAFEEFLNINSFTLTRANIASDKDYYTTYRKLLNSITLPDSYIDKMYTSKYVQHFYSEEEIEAFKAKWHRQSMTCVPHS